MIMERAGANICQEIRFLHVSTSDPNAHQFDFKSDYFMHQRNAYGIGKHLDHKPAILKPFIKSKKVKNLYYTGPINCAMVRCSSILIFWLGGSQRSDEGKTIHK